MEGEEPRGLSRMGNGPVQTVITMPLGAQRDRAGRQSPGDRDPGVPSPGFSAVQVQSLTAPSPDPQRVPDYLGCSIFATMFCFLPLGVAALVYSMKTWSANRAGTTAAARRNLMISRQLNIGAVLIGLIVHFVWVVRLIITVIERT